MNVPLHIPPCKGGVITNQGVGHWGGRFIDKWKKRIMRNHDFSWKSDIYGIKIKKQSVKPKSEKGGVLRLFADAGASLPLPIERTTQEL